MIPVVNEGSTHVVTASFRDIAGAAVTPTGGTYQVDDVASGTEIVPTTAFVPSGADFVISIPAAANRMLSAARAETRRLTVAFVFAGGSGTGEYLYQIKNLGGLPFPSESQP
jgi:hypothetical protein